MALFSRRSQQKAQGQAVTFPAPKGGLNLIVGAGQSAHTGWVATNRDTLDITSADHWDAFLKGRTVDRVLAEHVFEHLTPEDTKLALKNIATNLTPGGHIRIAVPDGHHPDPNYIEYVRPGGTGAGASDHKVLYTHTTLAEQLTAAGLQAQKLEYFDRDGGFHGRIWDQGEGPILRCVGSDQRNRAKPYAYTSLIIDGKKA